MARQVLSGYVDRVISIITNDGRNILGKLRGFDQTTNLILEGCTERIYSEDEGVEELELGLYLIRGKQRRKDPPRQRKSFSPPPLLPRERASAWATLRPSNTLQPHSPHAFVRRASDGTLTVDRVCLRTLRSSSSLPLFSRAGDCIAIVGEIDEERNAKLDLSTIK